MTSMQIKKERKERKNKEKNNKSYKLMHNAHQL